MKSHTSIGALAIAVLLCGTASYAQAPKDDPRSAPTAPLPPIQSGTGADSSRGGSGANSGRSPVGAARGVSPGYDTQPGDRAQVEPDTNTLAGAQTLGVGSLSHSRNTFDPSVNVSELGQTASGGPGTSTSIRSVTLLGGSLDYNRAWSRYRFTTTYTGGVSLYTGNEPNEGFDNLVVAQEIDLERWRIRLRDDFAASPGTAFSGTGMGGPGLVNQFTSSLGSSLSSLGQTFVPSETIETGRAMRYRNTVLGEVEYSFSRRSAFTLSGSYGLLHFTQAGFVNSHEMTVQGGYDYVLDPKNSIAVLASYGKIDYSGTSLSTSDYVAAIAYGRKITGQLAFQASAGPEEIRVHLPTSSFNLLTWSANSALTYRRRRTDATFSFARGLTGGSGVFFGATSSTVGASLHHQFSRVWSGTASGGYAFNRSLAAAGVKSVTFNNWFVGANIARQLGRHLQIGFNYGIVEQTVPASCPVASCGATGYQQTFGVTANWHLRNIETGILR